MKMSILSWVVVLFVSTFCPPLYGTCHEPSANTGGQVWSQALVRGVDSPSRIDGSYIVILDSKPRLPSDEVELVRTELEIRDRANRLTQRFGGEVDRIYSVIIHGFSVSDATDWQMMDLARSGEVEFVEVDRLAFPMSGGTQTFPLEIEGYWGLDRIDQATPPLDGSYTYPNGGHNYYGHQVFVMDSGIDLNHSEFSGRIFSGFNAADPEHNPNDIADCYWHGTHMAGIIGGSTYGVAKDAQFRPVRISDDCQDGTTSSSIWIDAIDWVAMARVNQMWVSWWQAHSAVLNISYRHLDDPTATKQALENLATNDDLRTVVILAAGNDNVDAGTFFVGDSPHLMIVGATAFNRFGSPGYGDDERWVMTPARGSNYGPCIDIFAPGAGILAAQLWGSAFHGSGTSQAAAFVSGAALLYIYQNPTATSSQIMNALTSNAVTGQITNAGTGSLNLLLNIEFL